MFQKDVLSKLFNHSKVGQLLFPHTSIHTTIEALQCRLGPRLPWQQLQSIEAFVSMKKKNKNKPHQTHLPLRLHAAVKSTNWNITIYTLNNIFQWVFTRMQSHNLAKMQSSAEVLYMGVVPYFIFTVFGNNLRRILLKSATSFFICGPRAAEVQTEVVIWAAETVALTIIHLWMVGCHILSLPSHSDSHYLVLKLKMVNFIYPLCLFSVFCVSSFHFSFLSCRVSHFLSFLKLPPPPPPPPPLPPSGSLPSI